MEVIVDIHQQRGKVHVTFSSGETFRVHKSFFRQRPLDVGDTIDTQEYEMWLMAKQLHPALDRAVAYLAARAHSRAELESKLLRCDYRPQLVELVLFKLEQQHLLDDSDFAQQWVEARTNRKLGRQRIAMELRRKGVSQEEAETALSSVDDEDQLENATALAEKAFARAKRDEDPRKTAQRIQAMLARRGYSWDIVREAVAKVMSDAGDDVMDE